MFFLHFGSSYLLSLLCDMNADDEIVCHTAATIIKDINQVQ